MSRLSLALPATLGAVLLLAGLALDRVLVHVREERQRLAIAALPARASEAAALVGAGLDAAGAAALEGRVTPDVTVRRIALPPRPMARAGAPLPAAREERLALLLSSRVTASGLPEAVVAALALDEPQAKQQVAARLLAGELPVREADLRVLAGELGVPSDDPRLAVLAGDLRELSIRLATEASSRFEWRADGRAVAGWAVEGGGAVSVKVSSQALERLAALHGVAIAGAKAATQERARAPVPGVDGLLVEARVDEGARDPIQAWRALAWSAVGLLGLALALHARASWREARALAKERAFLANVTHELRTPLAGLRAMGETLAAGRGDSREYGGLVAGEAQRLGALVERVLAAARSAERLKLEPCSPAEVLGQAIELSRERAARRGVTLRASVDEAPARATWDVDAVRGAIRNLVDNAIEHGREAGHVEIVARPSGASIRIDVRDDGPGIARKDRARIFGRFERGDTAGRGTGLGLFLVERVAAAHGGRVGLESRPGEGCTFTLELPLEPAP